MEAHIRWIIVNVLLGIQALVLFLMLPGFIRDLGWPSVILPIIVSALLIGSLLKNRIAFLLVFIWSVIVAVHAITLLIINTNWLYTLYIAFAAFQIYMISQTKLK